MSRVEGHDARRYHWRLGWHGWIDGRWELMGKSCYYTIELTLKLVFMTLLSLLPWPKDEKEIRRYPGVFL